MSKRSREAAGQASNGAPASQSAKNVPTIIVPLDGTIHAIAALPVGKGLAELEGATLHIVHVAEPILPPREVISKLGLTPEQLRGSVLNHMTGTPATSIARLAREWQSSFIVMCTHTRMDRPHEKLGSVAEEVLRLAPCPVVLVRPQRGLQPWVLRRILLPHDGTPTTSAAIGPAADLADRASAELVVLHVAAPGTGRPVEPGTFAAPRYLDQPQHEWPAWTQEFIQRCSALGHAPAEMKLRLLLAKGEPGAEIVRFAAEQNADLIVLGWRGQLEAERAATMKRVISDAPCPVLVTRVET